MWCHEPLTLSVKKTLEMRLANRSPCRTNGCAMPMSPACGLSWVARLRHGRMLTPAREGGSVPAAGAVAGPEGDSTCSRISWSSSCLRRLRGTPELVDDPTSSAAAPTWPRYPRSPSAASGSTASSDSWEESSQEARRVWALSARAVSCSAARQPRTTTVRAVWWGGCLGSPAHRAPGGGRRRLRPGPGRCEPRPCGCRCRWTRPI